MAGTPDFTIAAPPGITVHAGQRSTAVVNVTDLNNFGGAVHLSVAVSPSNGLTATISPANVTGSGTATLTMNAINNGTYTVTVTGTAGTITHSITPTVATPVYATLQTSNGTIVVELFRAQTPQTVSNFVQLAQSNFYNNLVWHRLSHNPPVIQTGDPNTRYGNTSRSTWGTGVGPRTVPLEIDNSLHNDLGFLGMARGQDVNSGSSQFYINMANNNALDGSYTVFGRVLGSGMNVANAIWATPTYGSGSYPEQPINPVFLYSVTISQ
jgi:cyclophilin family peptidyl-prolyl cis-trans isomerase